MKMTIDYEYLNARQCEKIKQRAAQTNTFWGSFGQNGDEPMKVRYLKDLDTDHLENILITQVHIGVMIKAEILAILKQRYSNAN